MPTAPLFAPNPVTLPEYYRGLERRGGLTPRQLLEAGDQLAKERDDAVSAAKSAEISAAVLAHDMNAGAHGRNSRGPSGGSVSLWYDDGFVGWHTYAHPEHLRYGFHGVACVVTDWVGTPGFLSLPQLTEMYASGLWTVANHSKAHSLGVTDETAKTAIQSAFLRIRDTWGFGRQVADTGLPAHVVQDIPFVAPGHGYSQAARKYAYLLHPYIRDISNGDIAVSDTVPGQTRFAITTSSEFRKVDAAGMTESRFRTFCNQLLGRVRMGFHVPVLFHDISDGADVWGIDVASYRRLLKWLHDLGIPVVNPSTVIKRHNLLFDSTFSGGKGWTTAGGRSGSAGFNWQNTMLDTYCCALSWDGVGISPALQSQVSINVEGGKTYRVTWWAKGDGDTSTRSQITVSVGGAKREGNPLGTYSITHESTLTTSYARFTGTFTAPKGAIGAVVFAEMAGTGWSGSKSVYIDCLTISDDSLEEYNLD